MKVKRKVIAWVSGILTAVAIGGGITACTSDADVASQNIATEAEQFRIERTIIFYNGITGDVLLSIKGKCSLEDQAASESQGHQLEVTCRIGPDKYTKDLLGLSDNVTYYAHQEETTDVSVYHHEVILKPENFLPGFRFEAGKQ